LTPIARIAAIVQFRLLMTHTSVKRRWLIV
jgi:hypothetical protein